MRAVRFIELAKLPVYGKTGLFDVKGGWHLANITAQSGESFESMLKRFNKKVQQDGIISEARRRGYYQKPLTRRARKATARRKQSNKASRASSRR